MINTKNTESGSNVSFCSLQYVVDNTNEIMHEKFVVRILHKSFYRWRRVDMNQRNDVIVVQFEAGHNLSDQVGVVHYEEQKTSKDNVENF